MRGAALAVRPKILPYPGVNFHLLDRADDRKPLKQAVKIREIREPPEGETLPLKIARYGV